MKKIKYISLAIIESIWHDLTHVYGDFARPKEVMNFFFWLAIIMYATNRFRSGTWMIAGYLITYVWSIIKQGRWKHKMRQEYKS